MSPRIIFERELEQLQSKVAEMGEYAEFSYGRLLQSVKRGDKNTLAELLENDQRMIEMLRSIEAGCLALMTKQQPVARDMRLVSAALKAVTDMERIGDHVSDVAELCLRREEAFSQEGCDAILLSMMEEAGTMLRESMEAFVENDVRTARRVIDSDDAVDDHFNRVKEYIVEAIRQQSMSADMVVDDLMIAKYLEKIGDHAVNIGRWAIFQVTGDIDGISLY